MGKWCKIVDGVVVGTALRESAEYNIYRDDVLAPDAVVSDKLKGVEFEGVMCSATAIDSSGLMEAREWVNAGNTTVFEFENGSELRLTPDNIGSFESVYKPFRASFFKE